MICPNCDTALEANEQLTLSHTYDDGTFVVSHEHYEYGEWVPALRGFDGEVKACPSGSYRTCSIH